MSLAAQLRSIKLTILMILAVSAALIGIVWALHIQTDLPLNLLTGDPASALPADFKGKRYVGFLSQVGILFWSASTTISLVTAYILAHQSKNPPLRKFFFYAGLISLLLSLDDVFLLHEGFPALTGMPEKVAFLLYLGLITFWLIEFHSIIFRSEYLLLGIAFIFFGCSIVIDIMNFGGLFKEFLEDTPKLIGILTWFAYFFRFGTVSIWSK